MSNDLTPAALAAVDALDARLITFAPISLQLAELEDLAVQDALGSGITYDLGPVLAACMVAQRRLMLVQGMDATTAEQLGQSLARFVACRLKEVWG